MGIVGTLSSIVIVAVNPQKFFVDATDAARNSASKEIASALFQYAIDQNGAFPTIPEGEANALPICQPTQLDASCVNLDALVPTYMTELPEDSIESCETYTGYKVYLKVGRAMVVAPHLGKKAGEAALDPDCPSYIPTPVLAVLLDGSPYSSGTSQNFGSLLVGDPPVTRTVTVQNTGDANLDFVLSTAVPTGFTVTPVTSPILGGSSSQFTITLDTALAGSPSGTLSYTTNGTPNPFTIPISGSVTSPDPFLASAIDTIAYTSGTPVDYGSTDQGTPVTKVVRITNTGQADLAFSLSSGETADFDVENAALISPIVPGAFIEFDVVMTAAAPGTPSTTLSFTTNAAPGTFTIPVSGAINSTLASGLFARWKFDETSGTTAADTVGLYNGTVVGSPTWSATVPPAISAWSLRSLQLNGTTQYMNASNVLNIERTTPFSISGWIRPADLTGNRMIVAKMESSGNYRGYAVFTSGQKLTVYVRNSISNALAAETTANVFTTGTWAHIAMTYDGSSTIPGIRLYINGVSMPLNTLVNSLSATMINTIPLNVGARNSGNSPFNGHLDDVRMYDRVLSPADVASLASGVE